jgi:hypothetical protein
METQMHKNLDMTLEAIAAMVLDYAAVAFIIGLLVFDRWLGIQHGIVLDTLLVLIALLSAAVWFAGSRLRQRVTRDSLADTDVGDLDHPGNTGTHG